MSTGDKKSNIYLKKFLPQQQMTDNFLEYLAKRDEENLKLQYPEQGYFFGNSMAGSGPDQITAATPSLATDGLGHLLKLDPSEAVAKFANALGIPYYVGMRYNVREVGTEVNVRTGQIEYTYLQDGIGEKGEPNAVIDNGSTLRLEVDGQFETGISHAGRQAVVYLKRAKGQADAFYTGLVTFVSGKNVVDTTHLLGQTAGLVSTDPSDYWVFIPGLTIRTTDIRSDINYVFLGIVTGGGAGTTPNAGQIDNTGAHVLYDGGSLTPIVNSLRSFLVGGGNIVWNLATEELTLGADIRFKPASVPFDYQIVADTFVIADGECGYIELTATGGIRPVVIAPLSDVPDAAKYMPMFLRFGNDIFFLNGALQLFGDPSSSTTGSIDGITKDLLDYIGATDESDADPDYVNATGSAKPNVHLTQADSLTKSIKKLELRNDVVTKVTAIDFNTTVLPITPAVTIDGQVLVNGNRVLFANPALNGVYQVAGIGTAASWTKLPVFGLLDTPANLSLVGVQNSNDEFIKSIFQYTTTRGWTPTKFDLLQGEPTGFASRTDSEILFDNGTRTLTLQPKAPATYFYVAVKGRLFKVETAKTVVIPNTEGIHYIYMDSAGVLQSTTVFDSTIITDNGYVAVLYWDATNGAQIYLGDERHGISMDGQTHTYLHEVLGAQFVSGLALEGFSVDGDGSSNAHAQFTSAAGIIRDEDIRHSILAQTQIPVYYRLGASGNWRKKNADAYPVIYSGTAGYAGTRLPFNEFTGGAWQLTELASNRYVLVHLFATNDIDEPVIAVQGIASYQSISSARLAALSEIKSLTGLPFVEFSPIGTVIYETVTSFTNAPKARVVSTDDGANYVNFRGATSLAPGASPNDHGNLSGLTDKDHPASAIFTDKTNFAGALTVSDDDVQKALETLDKHFQQLRIKPHASNPNRVTISAASITLSSGTVLEQQLRNLVLKFDGAQIDFSTGIIYEADGVTQFNGGANNFTPITPAAGQYRWLSITLLPSTVNANNTINAQLLVLAGTADGASSALAPRAAFATGTKIGQVVIQQSGGGIAAITAASISQQGTAGGGSGEGTGDANSFFEDLKARFRENFYAYLTRNIFSMDEQKLIDAASTGAYDIANSEYDLATIGQFLLSKNLLDSKFLTNFADAAGIELHVLWNLIDPSATYQASIDGGGNFSPITMDRVGDSGKFYGEIESFSPVSVSLHELAVANANALKVFNATTQQFQAMKITVASGEKHKILTGNLYLNKNGSPLGDLAVRIVKDNAGAPSSSAIDILSEQLVSISGLGSGNQTVPVTLAAILPAGDYWLVLRPSDSYRTSYSAGVTELSWRTDTTSPAYAPSDLNIYNGSAWSVVAGEDACFQLNGFKFDLRVKIISATTDVSLNGFGAFYQEEGAYTKDNVNTPEYQRFTVNGSSDQVTFPITNFIPDPETLRVFNGATAEALIFGDHFTINGQNIIFPAGTFLFPGKTFSVLFDQRMGFGQGNDRALAALASMGLGSSDALYDYSSAGAGPVLRSPDGTRYKLTVNDDGSLTTTAV